MLPFCGCDRGQYFEHWLRIGQRKGTKPPKLYWVNWFRKGDDGKFLWPGFGENSRVLEWIAERVAGDAGLSSAAVRRSRSRRNSGAKSAPFGQTRVSSTANRAKYAGSRSGAKIGPSSSPARWSLSSVPSSKRSQTRWPPRGRASRT